MRILAIFAVLLMSTPATFAADLPESKPSKTMKTRGGYIRTGPLACPKAGWAPMCTTTTITDARGTFVHEECHCAPI